MSNACNSKPVVCRVLSIDKAAERAEAMGVDIYIPGLPAAEAAPEPEPDPDNGGEGG